MNSFKSSVKKKFLKSLIVSQNILTFVKQMKETGCKDYLLLHFKMSSLTKDIGPSMVHKINYESSIKWNTLVWVVCGF